MNDLDRSQAPPAGALFIPGLAEPEGETWPNGVRFWHLRPISEPICRIELSFPAREPAEPRILAAAGLGLRALQEGTTSHSAAQIAETLAQYGAFLELSAGTERHTVTLYALSDQLGQLLGLLHELVTAPTFPEAEVATVRANQVEQLWVSLEKTAVLAGRAFKSALFGLQHPMGHSVSPETLSAVDSAQLHTWFQTYMGSEGLEIFLTGQLSEPDHKELTRLFGDHAWGNANTPTPLVLQTQSGLVHLDKPEAVQASLRLGKHLPARHHADAAPLSLLITIFGGYFGSRLMQLLREDKGYTYGISARYSHQLSGSHLLVGTDVIGVHGKESIALIEGELDRLANDLIPFDELDRARQYLKGSFLGAIGSPFSLMDRFKSRRFFGLGESFYRDSFARMDEAQPEQLRALAQTHLRGEDLTSVLCGP